MANQSIPHTPNIQDSRYLAMEWLEAIEPQDTIRCLVIAGEPPSKSRLTAGNIENLTRSLKGSDMRFAGNVAIVCLFFRSRQQRIDIDNLFKAVLDSGTKAGTWADDSQVTAIMGLVYHDMSSPRTVIALGEHHTSMQRGEFAKIPCAACGAMFYPAGRIRRAAKKNWCSRLCRTTLANKIPCPFCKHLFKRTNARTVYCSIKCRGAAQSKKDRAARKCRTHCKQGHLLTEANTHTLADGRRRCRICQAIAARRYRKGRKPTTK